MFLPDSQNPSSCGEYLRRRDTPSGKDAPHDKFDEEAAIIAEACSKPSGEERLVPRSHSRMPTATKVITPETRWRMDAIAVMGNRMVCRSRLTGLCFFTFLIMNNAHMLFLLFPGDYGHQRLTFCYLETSGFPSSGLLAGQTASFL